MPFRRELVADLETPVSAFLKVRESGPCFLLESVEHGERWGRYSFIGTDPIRVMRSLDGSVTWEGEDPDDPPAGFSPLELFRSALARPADHAPSEDMPFSSGAVGYIGYDTVRFLESVPISGPPMSSVPEMMMMWPGTVLVFDHLRQRMTLTGRSEEAIDRIVRLLEKSKAGKTLDLTEPLEVGMPPSSMTQTVFEQAVSECKEHILSGDVFQVVISHCFSRAIVSDPFDIYRVLRLVNPSPYMFFLEHPEVTMLGSSPEPLVKVEGGLVIQRPIAGTRPRGATPEEDLQIERAFVEDPKEKAEHVMLVDLARNDIGRVAEYGSVRVDELMTVERYSHVMHLVSQVSGKLRKDLDPLDALYASFPAGTVSGAPKIRAMELIDEIEPRRRGPYAGVVGYFDDSGNIDTCIALRTAYVASGTIYVQAGAGIVADSDPEAEWNETLNKARALLSAVQIAEQRAGIAT